MKLQVRPVWIVGAAALVLAGAIVAARGRGHEARYTLVPIDRGDIVDVVGATGALQAVTTVQVGSQVSGTIDSLLADFNSVVHKNEVIARLDTSLFEARLAQARANLSSAGANVEKARADVTDARQKYERAQELASQNLLPRSDLDTAKSTFDGAAAQLKAAEAAVGQAEAAVSQAQVDLAHTVITAPIDGVVIGRSVDVGQTVAASFQAPVLFTIANDLKHMQVKASIDEADIGRVQVGQEVTFHVDSYPNRTFAGRVEQIRLQPVVTTNVVTYDTLIAVENPDQRLMPGMTATVSVVIEKREDALRIPSAALRFRPEGYAVPETQRPPAAGRPGTGTPGAGRGERGPRGGTGPRPPREGNRPSVAFVLGDDGQPKAMTVRLGISDGRYVEVVEGLRQGDRVIIGLESDGGGTPRPGASPSTNPFAPTRPSPRVR